MPEESETIIGALDAIRDAILGSGIGIDFPHVAIDPSEEVLAFNNDEHHVLKGYPPPAPDKPPYFSATGNLTDLSGKVVPGGRIEAAFPLSVKPTDLPQLLYTWPLEQEEPWDGLPVHDSPEIKPPGPSKRNHIFGDGSTIVTIGYSLPKIARLKDGGALFWVNVLGVVSQGTGKYEGARGLGCSVGSAHFKTWPAKLEDQVKLLQDGFDVKVAAYLKVVLAKDLPKPA